MQLSLSSVRAGTIDLAEIEKGAAFGFQAMPGALGFGVPERTIGWSERLGDGANVTQRRVQRRRLDIPIIIETTRSTTPRASLIARHNQLLAMLTAPFVLTAYDEHTDETFTLNVESSSGGSATFGEDTDGETFFKTVIVVEAGDPFWTSATTTTIQQTVPAGTTPASLTINLMGNAPTPILWDFAAASPLRGNVGVTLADRPTVGFRYNFLDGGVRTWRRDTESGTDSFYAADGPVGRGSAVRDVNIVGGWKRMQGGTSETFLIHPSTASSMTVYASYKERRLGLL